MTSLFAHILPASNSGSGSGKHLTDAPDIPRTEIGPAAIHLKRELVAFYWAGVKRELPHILLTLRKWQTHDDYSTTVLPDEEDAFIHGYDTFLDQVSHSSRQFTDRNAVRREQQSPDGLPTYEEALENRGWDFYSEMKSNKIRTAIRDSLSLLGVEDIQRRRARMLLQSAQFLDIDKVIEYREPEKLLSFWKRPAVPQLTAMSCDELHMPMLVPQTCSECHSTIRSSLFKSVEDESVTVCERCYRENHYGKAGFRKLYKTCCLTEVMTPEMSRKICHCPSVQRRDRTGKLRPLWPFQTETHQTSPGDSHINGDRGKVRCGLHDLTDMVAEAKYSSTRRKAEKTLTLETVRRRGTREEEMAALLKGQPRDRKDRPSKLHSMNIKAVPEFGSSSYGQVTETVEDIPVYLRSVTDKYPYGNVHMALRIGPMIIENGVANTHGGVLVTSRDPPKLQVLRDSPSEIEHSLLLTGKTERTLWSQRRPRAPKRYKAMMKQVAGGAFSGLFNPTAENDLIDTLLDESKNMVEEGLSASDKAALLEASTQRLLVKLQVYLSSRIELYISTVIDRLLDPELELRWNFQNNNCQMFCDNLIDRDAFGSLFAPHARSDKFPNENAIPLYLMSFVCRPGAYVKEKTKSKFDVPNGLTEEYLLKFRYGRHDESDVIDTLAEYWYDWGGFERPVYPYQDVFPWDCTEAYGRYPIKCSECNIAKHVWAFPFDSWSMISLHLARGRQLYPQDDGSAASRLATGHMSDLDWFRNRLTILLGQDALLTAAVAMSRCGPFRASTLWIHMQLDETKDRLKLGGIHRAQPFSHHFEKGAYHQYFVAEWASLARPLRIEAYERLRDWRATRVDVGRTDSDGDDSGGCGGGCGGFACGAFAVGCAGGCGGQGGDSCGSGCVSSCGGGDGGGDGGCGGGGCGGCGG